MKLLNFAIALFLAHTVTVHAGTKEARMAEALTAYEKSDYETAYSEFHLLAEEGESDAQHKLGIMYERQQGVEQNIDEAARWWGLAADQGHAAAQADLGILYVMGRGVPKNWVKAYMLFSLAAAAGNDKGKRNFELAQENLTPEQIAEGDLLVQEWRLKKPK